MYGPLALAVAALIATTVPKPNPTLPLLGRHLAAYDRPRVNVWLNREDPYRTGEPARVYFKSNIDAYITVLRIDTDGRIRVLFPVEPWEDNFARGGRTFEVLGRSQDDAFRVDDAAGVGYVFAVAAPDPFYYDEITRGDHWDYRAISDGQVRGDPYVAMTDLAARIAGVQRLRLRRGRVLRRAALRLSALRLLRLPRLRQLSLLGSLQFVLLPIPHRDLRRSLLLPVPALRWASRRGTPLPPGAAVCLQGFRRPRRLRDSRGNASPRRHGPARRC